MSCCVPFDNSISVRFSSVWKMVWNKKKEKVRKTEAETEFILFIIAWSDERMANGVYLVSCWVAHYTGDSLLASIRRHLNYENCSKIHSYSLSKPNLNWFDGMLKSNIPIIFAVMMELSVLHIWSPTTDDHNYNTYFPHATVVAH